MLTNDRRACWVRGELGDLVEGRAIELSPRIAKIKLSSASLIPEECNLLFTPDGRVGRRCVLVQQTADHVTLCIVGRIGPQQEEPPHLLDA
jgi:hypothetical protein